MHTHVARLFVLMTAAALLSLPGSTFAREPQINPAWPDWLKEAMAREHKRIKYEPLSIGPFETVMPGKVTDREVIDEATFYAASDDGSGGSFECWFYNETMDMASSTVSFAEAIIDTNREAYGPVDNRSIYHVDAGAIDGAPYLSLEWMYTVGEAPNAQVGFTKIRAAESDGAFVICSHPSAGYRASFAKSFDQMVRKLSRESGAPTPYYREVIVHNLNDLNIGITQLSMTLDADGDTRIDTSDAMLLPVSGSDLRSSDSSTVSWSTPDGYLINEVHSSVENGELVSNLSLAFTEEGTWQVAGTLSGKDFSETLDGSADPVSTLGEMLAVRSLLGDGDSTRQQLDTWIPSADPSTFLSAVIELDESSDVPGAGVVTMGPLRIAGEFEPSGSMKRGTMDFGALKLNFERVFSSGNIR